MQDVFVEYLVKQRSDPKKLAMKAGIAVLAAIVAATVMIFSRLLGPLSMIGPLLGVGALYGAYYLITSLNLEFEYIITNGEMDIDKIIAQRKRLRIVTVNMRQVDDFGKYKPQEHGNKNYQTKIFACDSPDSGELWYCVANIKDKGQTLVVFNANEKMLNAMKSFLPRPIMHKAFQVGAY